MATIITTTAVETDVMTEVRPVKDETDDVGTESKSNYFAASFHRSEMSHGC